MSGQTPKQKFTALAKGPFVAEALRNAIQASFQFTQLDQANQKIALDTAGAIGSAVPQVIWTCMFDAAALLNTPQTQLAFLLNALGGIKANIVIAHFDQFFPQNGGKASVRDIKTMHNALVSAFLLSMGELLKQSFTGVSNSSHSNGEGNSDKQLVFFWNKEDIEKNDVRIPFPDSPSSTGYISTTNAPIYDINGKNFGRIIIEKNATQLNDNKNTFFTSRATTEFDDGSSLVSYQTYNSLSPYVADPINGSYIYKSGRFQNTDASFQFEILPDTKRRVIINYSGSNASA